MKKTNEVTRNHKEISSTCNVVSIMKVRFMFDFIARTCRPRENKDSIPNISIGGKVTEMQEFNRGETQR